MRDFTNRDLTPDNTVTQCPQRFNNTDDGLPQVLSTMAVSTIHLQRPPCYDFSGSILKNGVLTAGCDYALSDDNF